MASVTLELPPETEQKLREKASQHGQSLEAYLQHVVEREAHGRNGTPAAPAAEQPAPGVLDFLDGIPPGRRTAAAWEEREREFQEGRDRWER